MSQVNGSTSSFEMSLVTGFDESRIVEILNRLRDLGAIRFDSTSEPTRSSSIPPVSATRSTSEVTAVNLPRHRPPGFDEALLDEAADLDRETKAEILDLFFRLDRDSYYEILGVTPEADKKAIKAAYFERVNVFHTDRFFGKELGAYKSRLERIFATLTKAHDTLSKERTRQEYDRYWASRNVTRGVRDSLPPSAAPSRPSGVVASAIEPQIPRAPRAPQLDERDTLVSEIPASDRDSDPSLLPPSGVRTPDPAAARRLLAKKFGMRDPVSSRVPEPEPTPVPAVDREQMRRAVSEQLRARYEARQGQSAGPPVAQVNRYIDMAREARTKGEWGSALNNLRIALTLAPDDARLTTLLQEYQVEADRLMADQFVEQAKYEEADGHYDRAARSYERAARGKQAAHQGERAGHLYERAAFCLMESGGDKRRVVELARLGVTCHPGRPHAHLTLARAYALAGMKTSAQGEVGRALEIEPNHEEAKALQKQLK